MPGKTLITRAIGLLLLVLGLVALKIPEVFASGVPSLQKEVLIQSNHDIDTSFLKKSLCEQTWPISGSYRGRCTWNVPGRVTFSVSWASLCKSIKCTWQNNKCVCPRPPKPKPRPSSSGSSGGSSSGPPRPRGPYIIMWAYSNTGYRLYCNWGNAFYADWFDPYDMKNPSIPVYVSYPAYSCGALLDKSVMMDALKRLVIDGAGSPRPSGTKGVQVSAGTTKSDWLLVVPIKNFIDTNRDYYRWISYTPSESELRVKYKNMWCRACGSRGYTYEERRIACRVCYDFGGRSSPEP